MSRSCVNSLHPSLSVTQGLLPQRDGGLRERQEKKQSVWLTPGTFNIAAPTNTALTEEQRCAQTSRKHSCTSKYTAGKQTDAASSRRLVWTRSKAKEQNNVYQCAVTGTPSWKDTKRKQKEHSSFNLEVRKQKCISGFVCQVKYLEHHTVRETPLLENTWYSF